ncbi:MAG: sensor domain-containing diguanylate cyclase, partial [Betaproteobacteria bacterium]|nr:sensor domain-containing diguanylate cyclase [Betaproteobacteria bacterium]
MVSRRLLVAIAGGIGAVLALIGLTVMVSWLLHWPRGVKIGGDHLVIVFATGLNLVLLGAGLAALVVGALRPSARWADRAACLAGGAAAVLCTLRLVEVVSGWPVAFDFP